MVPNRWAIDARVSPATTVYVVWGAGVAGTGVTIGVGEAVGVGATVGVGEGEGDAVGVGRRVGDAVGEGLGGAVGDAPMSDPATAAPVMPITATPATPPTMSIERERRARPANPRHAGCGASRSRVETKPSPASSRPGVIPAERATKAR